MFLLSLILRGKNFGLERKGSNTDAEPVHKTPENMNLFKTPKTNRFKKNLVLKVVEAKVRDLRT